MMTPDLIRFLLPGLLLLPLAAGVALRFLAGRTARGAALAFAVAQLALTAAVVAGGMFEVQDTTGLDALTNLREKRSGPVFAPRCVPGDPMPDGKQTFTTKYDVMPFSERPPEDPRGPVLHRPRRVEHLAGRPRGGDDGPRGAAVVGHRDRPSPGRIIRGCFSCRPG